MATALRKAFSRATITATRTTATVTPVMSLTPSGSALCLRHRALSTLLLPNQGSNSNDHNRQYSTKRRSRKNKDDKDYSDDIFDNNYSPSAASTRAGKGEYNGDPDLYRIFFRSPDKMRSLEEAQVFINHIKSSYGPLTQYQFARCPETRKYFGYGFLTFKNKDSLDKALADAYIRVGMKDFELIRSENNNRNRKPVKFKNTGFSGFNNLEELRAKKQQEAENAKSRIVAEKEEEKDVKEQASVEENGTTFVSALPSSPPTTTKLSTTTTSTDNNSNGAPSSTSKPYFVPLQKKGMAQLWKIIPNEIERAEQISKQADESEQEPAVTPKVDSKKLAAELVGDILDAKP
ncbi:hypothetical protein BG015_006180 [Linnemannia schmuckeri]|uniref:RRM domain-containing protein n=1 Tax=Linnemannia schmuckeri TaxID=64567 RepID=A0A9P5VC22_9FUNG|nr:hypothetical protein BG015_006180 [Linnemannia schmuckeri]